MVTGNTLPQQIASVRHDTITLLGDITEKAKGLLLPEPTKLPPVLEDYRRRLIGNAYQVLVVGEAKRGKSSFINALIGREILPVDVDVATSQVFCIRQAASEAYRVRFEDGSTLEITAADLDRYGKYQDGEQANLPSLEKMIRWIEVDIPMHFLPPGVSILDTPGVGVLYSAHEQITQRFVPYADAIIFVLDSIQPIIQEELNFINTILDVTPNILFIQTKIDLQRQEDWQAILRRNQQILQDRFGSRLRSTHIWPISSTYLMEAVQPGGKDDEDYLRMSRFKELATALQVFLFRAAGWEHSAQAVQLAEAYHYLVRQALVAHVASLTEESEQKRHELQQQVGQRKQQFDSEWSENGAQRKALLASIQKVVTENQRAFLRVLQPDSQVENEARVKIDALSSVKELQAYSQAMAGQVIGTVLSEWRNVRQQAYDQVQVLLVPLLTFSLSFTLLEETDILSELTTFTRELTPIVDMKGIVDQVRREGVMIENTIGILFALVSDEEGDLESVEPIARVTAMLWMGVRAWYLRREAQIAEARQLMHEQLNELLHSMRQKFLSSEASGGIFNRVEAFFAALVEDTSEQVLKIVEQKSGEMQAEIDRIAEESAMGEQQRQAKAEQAQAQLAAWDTITASIKSIAVTLKSLEQSFGTL